MDRNALESRTLEFAGAVFTWCHTVRDAPGGRAVSDQLRRCAASVAANYRATSRARSGAEFLSKLMVVTEEADEAVFWLELADRTDLGAAAARADLLAESRELRAIFAASCRTVRRTLGARNRRR